MARELKSDRLSFVLDKELTPILDKIARKMGMTRSKLVNETVLQIIMDNVGLLDVKTDRKDIVIVDGLIKQRELKKAILEGMNKEGEEEE